MDEINEEAVTEDEVEVDSPEVHYETTTSEVEPENNKSVEEVAREVLAGRWGRGHDRERRLRVAGYNVVEINLAINDILGRR